MVKCDELKTKKAQIKCLEKELIDLNTKDFELHMAIEQASEKEYDIIAQKREKLLTETKKVESQLKQLNPKGNY